LEEAKLIASAAVLRAIYDEKKDIYDILVEFIKATINTRSILNFSSMECVGYLKEDYGFRIPEAIIKSCLKNRLVKSGMLRSSKGMYSTTPSLSLNDEFELDFDKSKKEYDEIITRLYEYCIGSQNSTIEKNELEKSLEIYLTRPDKHDKYTDIVAGFIVSYESEPGFKDKLNKIEEGLIIYTGIRFSPDLSTLGSWRGDLTIFLDAEHLFNATGLNGPLYKTLFDDFYELASEVNRNKNGGKISLKYLDETHHEIDSFFYAAQKKVESRGFVDPSKTAMVNICNGCKYPSDVITKKAGFMSKIQSLKISREQPLDYYSKPEFNIESSEAIEKLHLKLKDQNITKDEISSIMKMFTKINFLRRGKNNCGIDLVSAIFLTESWLPQRMAFSEQIFEGNGAIPFATNIEFITEKLWFKLNKGFGGNSKKPASFDPIIRAKLTISAQISRSVSSIYRSLSEQYADGRVTQEEVAMIHHEIYTTPSRPEDISADTISITQELLTDHYIDRIIREKRILERDALYGRQAAIELQKIKYTQRQQNNIKHKNKSRCLYSSIKAAIYILPPLLLATLCTYTYTKSDTMLSLFFGMSGLASIIVPLYKPKKIHNFILSISRNSYRNSLSRKKG
jgi:hypothetical protein